MDEWRDWHAKLGEGINAMLHDPAILRCAGKDHISETPRRVVEAYQEIFSGCGKDPAKALTTDFAEETYDQMIHIADMEIFSTCSHHLLPFFGKCHFAYIPQGKIVGLSKIPRFIDILARRPQVQERLSDQIVDTFMEVVKPKGCGVFIECVHMCMRIRGVRAQGATRTTSLRGNFADTDQPHVKQEFLGAITK